MILRANACPVLVGQLLGGAAGAVGVQRTRLPLVKHIRHSLGLKADTLVQSNDRALSGPLRLKALCVILSALVSQGPQLVKISQLTGLLGTASLGTLRMRPKLLRKRQSSGVPLGRDDWRFVLLGDDRCVVGDACQKLFFFYSIHPVQIPFVPHLH